MSAIAGIFRRDIRERVDGDNLRDLEKAIMFLGPDEGSSRALGPVGLIHRALNTRTDATVSQPFRRGTAWIVFDGYLSNRDELLNRFGHTSREDPTDVDLVLSCHEKWGLNAFERIEGAFAFCVWEMATQRLFLARDPMGIRPLFLRSDPHQHVWCSALEPLVLGANRTLTLNCKHVHKLFTSQPCLDTTCYEEILAVPPGMVVALRPESVPIRRRFWSLAATEPIRLHSDADYEEQFRLHLTRSVSQCLRSRTTVTAELSGGLDSSTIVCIADRIRGNENQSLIETISYFDTDEPSGDERPYIAMVEQQRDKVGQHISFADFRRLHQSTELQPLTTPFQASPGRFAHNLQRQSIIHQALRDLNSRVLLSGLGGDEFLGGVPYGAPEIADHLFAYRFVAGAKSLLAWSIARQQTIWSCWEEVSALLRAQRLPTSMLESPETAFPWLLQQRSSETGVFTEFSDWPALTPSQLTYEWLRSKLASQFTIAGTPLFGGTETRYPLLDLSLFRFLASIPRDQVLRAGERRRLQRRALHGIVPAGILTRRTKWFGLREAHELLRSESANEVLAQDWLTSGLFFDMKLLRQAHRNIVTGNPGPALPLQMAIALEQWLRKQVEQGTIATPTPRSA
ncbi:asparagine synthetase B [Terriglobus sp. TAA 43]|uniref:asparagine synthetase B family protein n=1 Tax=Terriglobus sp. TAA 43 TaxID=278961 RepID=UPI000646C67A|nr:asparagine synthase-related protein [Terriglobus sp. TAA 43]